MKFRRTRIFVLAFLLVFFPARTFAMKSYVGVVGALVGMGLDWAGEDSDTSYFAGLRFESVSVEYNISLIVQGMLQFGTQLPTNANGTWAWTDVGSLYNYYGAVIRYEDAIVHFSDNPENVSGLYLGVGLGAYYGWGLRFTRDGDTISYDEEELDFVTDSSKVLDGVINIEAKLMLDFDGNFGMYPFFDVELIPFRNYLINDGEVTDKSLKARFLAGITFAFAWE